MKANELMIGDWVYNKNIDKPMQVYPAMFSQMFRQKPDAKTEDYNIFPIPLTPEILEKNGFEIRGKRKYFLVPNDQSLAIKREPIIGANGNSFLIGHFWERNKEFRWFAETDYVHELQHALRLCGIEHEITL